MGLTPKQEKFCENVASGMSYKDSYINAYNTKGKDSTVFAESGKLALRDDIQERIKALQKPLEQAVQIQGLNAKQQQIQAIQDRITLCIQKDDENSLIRYYDMLNKLYGLYKESEQPEQQTNNITKLDTDILKRLASNG